MIPELHLTRAHFNTAWFQRLKMGFTGLARWVNAPTTGLDFIRDNILRNHNGRLICPWRLSIKSYRSSLASIPGVQVHAERIMIALAMNENVFVLTEDPSAPSKADLLATLVPGASASVHIHGPAHCRTTYVTLRPPDALDQLLTQTRARWLPAKHAAVTSQRGQTSQGYQIAIDGHVFSIGNEWLVRAGNVILAGGAIKGMLLEAEYLPLPVLHSNSIDGTSEFLSNLLTSLLPHIRDAKTMAITISDSQWDDCLWDREEEVRAQTAMQEKKEDELESIYFSEGQEVAAQKGDWIGVERDRKSAFLIIGALRAEGLL